MCTLPLHIFMLFPRLLSSNEELVGAAIMLISRKTAELEGIAKVLYSTAKDVATVPFPNGAA